MSDQPVNLNRFRKAKARTDKQVHAAENTEKFGRSKANKTREELQSDATKRHLDNHRLDQNRRDK